MMLSKDPVFSWLFLKSDCLLSQCSLNFFFAKLYNKNTIYIIILMHTHKHAYQIDQQDMMSKLRL
jgi:hypothetical protein